MTFLEKMEANQVFEITELNTRKVTFEDDLQDIFHGDEYRKHSFKNRDEAKAFEKELNAKGIKTNFACVNHIV